MTALLDLLAAGLERPRPLSEQVYKQLSAQHGIGRDEAARFLEEELPKLEDFEVDLALSAVFTPTLADQAPVAGYLVDQRVPEAEWPGLIRHLVERPCRAALGLDGDVLVSVPLREVLVERYVRRLRLDGTVDPEVLGIIRSLAPERERAMLLAVARRAVWESPGRLAILQRHLARFAGEDRPLAGEAAELLRLVETYQPADAAQLLGWLPSWREAIRKQIEDADQPSPFFNERVQELHGLGRDQRGAAVEIQRRKRAELELLERLAVTLSN